VQTSSAGSGVGDSYALAYLIGGAVAAAGIFASAAIRSAPAPADELSPNGP
jgi:hypothetical protein